MFCIFLGREFESKGFQIFVTNLPGDKLGAVWLSSHSILLALFFLFSSPLYSKGTGEQLRMTLFLIRLGFCDVFVVLLFDNGCASDQRSGWMVVPG